MYVCIYIYIYGGQDALAQTRELEKGRKPSAEPTQLRVDVDNDNGSSNNNNNNNNNNNDSNSSSSSSNCDVRSRTARGTSEDSR